VQRGYSNQHLREFREVPRQNPSVRRKVPQTDSSEYKTRYTPPPPEIPTSPSSATSDWDTKIDQDWDLDKEPTTSDSTQQDFQRDFPKDSNVSVRTNYEVPQEPKTSSKIGSVYSYGYREKEQKDSGVGKADEVYDANYRLIRPPYKQPIEPTRENEEDWDFDDEDF
jgi:hypothetical protein